MTPPQCRGFNSPRILVLGSFFVIIGCFISKIFYPSWRVFNLSFQVFYQRLRQWWRIAGVLPRTILSRLPEVRARRRGASRNFGPLPFPPSLISLSGPNRKRCYIYWSSFSLIISSWILILPQMLPSPQNYHLTNQKLALCSASLPALSAFVQDFYFSHRYYPLYIVQFSRRDFRLYICVAANFVLFFLWHLSFRLWNQILILSPLSVVLLLLII